MYLFTNGASRATKRQNFKASYRHGNVQFGVISLDFDENRFGYFQNDEVSFAMGAKSSNVITEKQMLPLFQVISDLEKVPTSSASLQTNFSSFVENVSIWTDKSSSGYIEPTNDHSSDVTIDANDKKRHKKRRRLKETSCRMSKKGIRDEKPSLKKHQLSKLKTINVEKSQSSSEHSNDIQVSIGIDDEKSSKGKRIGMFTAMALDMYKDEEVDMSRHFKDLNNEDFDFDMEKNVKSSDQDFPIYEVPTDVIAQVKADIETSGRRIKKKKKKDIDNGEVDLNNKFGKGKISRKAIIQKYENMLSVLLEKSQQKESIINDRDRCIAKMKKKIKQMLVYNNQFADENEYMKRQHDDMKACIEQYKMYISSLEDRQDSNEQRRLSDTPIVNQICSRCSITEATCIKFEKDNIKLNEDVIMLKNVVFRLNVQLSRYQEKLHNATHSIPKYVKGNIAKDHTENEGVSIPSLPIFPMLHTIENTEKTDESLNTAENLEGENAIEEPRVSKPSLVRQTSENTYTLEYERCTTWGDVNTHTLAPLLNAYQESLLEKDELIRDYEREFNRFTSKLKQIVNENDNLHMSSAKMATELAGLRETCGLTVKERDDLRKENFTLKEKSSELEIKLKNMHECYEQKVESMSRDYTFIHQEYFKTKTGLAAAQGRCQVLEDQHKSTQIESMMPVKAHMMRIDECKNLFDELKVRYDLEKSKLSTRLSVLQESIELLEKKHLDISNRNHDVESKLKRSEGLVRKYRRIVVALRKEVAALSTSRDLFKHRASRATELCRKMALMLDQVVGDDRIQQLKMEAMTVQKEALKELNAVEERMKTQNINLIKVQEENMLEISKLNDLLKEKDAKIEAMRLHINGERLKKYASQAGTSRKLPIDLIQTKAELVSLRARGTVPIKTTKTELRSSSLVPIKGGYFIKSDKSKLSQEKA